jgi:hypothetical protein
MPDRMPAPPDPGHWTYAPIACQYNGNAEAGFHADWRPLADGATFRTRQAAISAGIEDCGSDDFNVATLDGRTLIALGWMDEDFTDPGNLTEPADQLGFDLAPAAS